jgi:colanic acid biosynthesis glycosyl transferase WcaI
MSLRITIIGLNYAPEPTGNAPYTTSLAQGLSRAGHEVRVLTGFPHYPEWRLREGYKGWSRREAIDGVPVRRLRHFIPKQPSSLKRMLMEITFGLRAMTSSWHRPDVVIFVSPALLSTGLASLRLHLCRRRPASAIWVQDLYSRGVAETNTGGSVASRAMTVLEGSILRSADSIVVIHDRFRDYVHDNLGLARDRIKVVRNWTHLRKLSASDPLEMRQRLGWLSDDIVVLHAGNMGRKQGLENVLKAARIAQERQSRVRFVLLGDGNQRPELERNSHALERLQFIDPLPGDDFQKALAGADFLLVNELPGVRDMAVPSKLTSYFDAGVPVIAATDEGSVTAVEIAASEGGIRVDPSTPSALVEAAERLAQDPAMTKAMGIRGRRFRHETLSEEAAMAKYNDLVMSLALSRGR